MLKHTFSRDTTEMRELPKYCAIWPYISTPYLLRNDRGGVRNCVQTYSHNVSMTQNNELIQNLVIGKADTIAN